MHPTTISTGSSSDSSRRRSSSSYVTTSHCRVLVAAVNKAVLLNRVNGSFNFLKTSKLQSMFSSLLLS